MAMGGGYYLKAFPVWFARRGNYGVLLSQAKGLSTAAHLRGDWKSADLAQKQLEWVVGRNPFVQSTMWGEGYDFTQQYSVSSGDIVGSLPVGMMTRGNSDVPYWPPQNCYVYKEVWVHSSARWLWLMQDLAGPALVEGRVKPGVSSVEFAGARAASPATGVAGARAGNQASGLAGGGQAEGLVPASPASSVKADAGGAFRAFLPEGNYVVRAGGEQTSVTLLPGGAYSLDLRPGQALDFRVTQETSASGETTIRLTARGSGRHTFVLRTDNLIVDPAEKEVVLQPGKPASVMWKGHANNANAPWLAVVIPDENMELRREVLNTR